MGWDGCFRYCNLKAVELICKYREIVNTMDPRLLFLLPGLAACPASQAQPTLCPIVAQRSPVHRWPELAERPESEHPAHGEGSGESPTVVGVAASGVFSNVTAQRVWLENDYSSAPSSSFLDGLFMEMSSRSNLTLRLQSHAKQSFRDATTRRSVGARSGR